MAAPEIKACASTSGLSVTGSTPSLQTYIKTEGSTCFGDRTVAQLYYEGRRDVLQFDLLRVISSDGSCP